MDALFTYGLQGIVAFGVVGVLVRMNDKLKRSLSITASGIKLVDNESLRDTLIDLHNYSAMAIMLQDEQKSITMLHSNK